MINKEEILRKAKKNSSRKRRLSLIFSLPVSLLSVFTAAVSTFAWYQASSASIEISGESTTTISVAAPDTLSLNPAVVYAYNSNGTQGYSGDASGRIDAGNVTNFTKIYDESDDTNLSSRFSTSALLINRKVTFAAVISEEESNNLSSVTLTLSAYTKVNKNNRKILNNSKTAASGNIIAIEEIVNVYAGINTTGIYGLDGLGDKFNYTSTSLPVTSADGSDATKLNITTPITLASGTSLNSSTVYIFYTIELSNSSNTYYQEYYDEDDDDVIDEELYDTPANDNNDRFFAKKTAIVNAETVYYGNSNCYEGLGFTIRELKVTAN